MADSASKEDGDRSKTFFTNKYLTITEHSIDYRSMDLEKKIYIRNISGYSFYRANIERASCAMVFLIGLAALIAYFVQYPLIYVLVSSILIIVGAIIKFIMSKDKLNIYSNASLLSISYPLGMMEKVEHIQDALDDAIKYSRKK